MSTVARACPKGTDTHTIVSQIWQAGGIAKLVGVLLGFSANTMKESTLIQLCTLAASAIKEMANGNRKNQDAITDAGAIVPLVAMLSSPAAEMQANAAGALANLAHNHPENQGAIARTGAVAPLCSLMKEVRHLRSIKPQPALCSLSLAPHAHWHRTVRATVSLSHVAGL